MPRRSCATSARLLIRGPALVTLSALIDYADDDLVFHYIYEAGRQRTGRVTVRCDSSLLLCGDPECKLPGQPVPRVSSFAARASAARSVSCADLVLGLLLGVSGVSTTCFVSLTIGCFLLLLPAGLMFVRAGPGGCSHEDVGYAFCSLLSTFWPCLVCDKLPESFLIDSSICIFSSESATIAMAF